MATHIIFTILSMVIPCIIALSTVDESGSLKSLIDQQNRLLQEFGTKLQTMEKKIKGLNALEVELAEQKETIERQNALIKELREKFKQFQSRDIDCKITSSKEKTVQEIGTKLDNKTWFGHHRNQTVDTNRVKTNNIDGTEKRLLAPVTNAPTSSPALSTVAFCAFLSKSELHLAEHHTLIFDNVQTNSGNGYNKISGSFIVPRAGIYVFTWTLVYHLSGEICTNLIINGVENGNGYAHGTSAPYQTSTSLVVVHVQQGDTVLVRTNNYSGCNQAGTLIGDKWRRSSFSGWLLN